MQHETGTAQMPSKPDFALIGHPFDMDHLYRYLKYHKPDLKKPGSALLLKLFEWTPPFTDRWIEVASPSGRSVKGAMIMCPLLPEMIQKGVEFKFRTLCVEKVIAALGLAAGQGARIAGLGGFTSIADGDQGRLVAQKVPDMAVSSGNTLTAMSAVDGVITAAEMLGVSLSDATVTVVGAAGDIGMACCRFLVSKVKRLVLVSRFSFNLHQIAEALRHSGPAQVIVEPDNHKAVALSDVVITAASSAAPIFHQRDFKPGAIVCDVGYPKNIFADYDMNKAEIFLFAGGLLESPSPVLMPYDTGLPAPGVIYGCWSETIVLALAERYESFSLGRGLIVPEKMQLIWDLAMRYGFRRAPFFFGKEIWKEKHVERLRALRNALMSVGE